MPHQETTGETASFALAEEHTAPAWHLLKRIAFRFSFCYIVLYYLPSVAEAIPYAGVLLRPHALFISFLERWVGLHLFYLGDIAQRRQTGSGDTALDYVQQLLLLVLALAGGLLWTALDRRRPHYVTLHGWLRVLARYALAFTLLQYGFAKILPTQFTHLSAKMMLEPYGDSSPMALLWNFMGYSTAYTVFAGLAEAGPALLLLFRRTALLGACLAAGVLLNIVLLNFCYDVPVKLYSLNLFSLALFLVPPDTHRLSAVFLRNRPAPPAPLDEPRLQKPSLRRAALAVKGFILVLVLVTVVRGHLAFFRQMHQPQTTTPLSGLYLVQSYTRNGQPAPPSITGERWHRLLAAYPRYSWVWPADGKETGVQTQYDTAANTVTFTAEADEHGLHPGWRQGTFHYRLTDNAHAVLDGTLDNTPVTITLVKEDTDRYPLVSRGFHWIQEFPFNR